jgi:hypothetical protein
MPSQTQQQLSRDYFRALVEAALPLKNSDDPEVTLNALIHAAQMLREHLEQELEELRLEQAE